MTNVNLAFTAQQLNELVKDDYSCVRIVKNAVKHIAFHPYYLNDIKNGVRETLNEGLTKYDKILDGILLYYRNPKLMSNFGGIDNESLQIHIDILADFYVFCPIVGRKLRVVVNKKSADHVGCLAHKMFNVTIPRPSDEDASCREWPGKYVGIGQEILVEITFTNFDYPIPHIRAEFDPKEDYGEYDGGAGETDACGGLENADSIQTFMNVDADVVSNTAKRSEENDTAASIDDDEELGPERERSPKRKKRKREPDDIEVRSRKKKKKLESAHTDDEENDRREKKSRSTKVTRTDENDDVDLSFSEIYHEEDVTPKVGRSVEKVGFSELFSSSPVSERTGRSKSPKKTLKQHSPLKNKNSTDSTNEECLDGNRNIKETRPIKKSLTEFKKEEEDEINTCILESKYLSLKNSPKKSPEHRLRSNNKVSRQFSDESEYSEDDDLNADDPIVSKRSGPQKTQEVNPLVKSHEVKKSDSENDSSGATKEIGSREKESPRSSEKLSGRPVIKEEPIYKNEASYFDERCNEKILVKVPKTPRKKQRDENGIESNTSIKNSSDKSLSSKKKGRILDDYFVIKSKKTSTMQQNLFDSTFIKKVKQEPVDTEADSNRVDVIDRIDSIDAFHDRRATFEKNMKTPERSPVNIKKERISIGATVESVLSSSDTVDSAKRKKSKKHKRDREADKTADSILADIIRTTLSESERTAGHERLSTPLKIPETSKKEALMRAEGYGVPIAERVSETADEFAQFLESAKRKKSKKHKKDKKSDKTTGAVNAAFSGYQDCFEKFTLHIEETDVKKKTKKSKKRSKESFVDDVDDSNNADRSREEFNYSLNSLLNSTLASMEKSSFKQEKKKKKKKRTKYEESVDDTNRTAEETAESVQRSNLEDYIDRSSGLDDSKKKAKKKKSKDKSSANVTSENGAMSTKSVVETEDLNESRIDADENDDSLQKSLRLLLSSAMKETSSEQRVGSSKKKKKKSKESRRPESSEITKRDTKRASSPAGLASNEDVDKTEPTNIDDIRQLLLKSAMQSLTKTSKKRKSSSNDTDSNSATKESKKTPSVMNVTPKYTSKALVDESTTRTPGNAGESFDFGVPDVTSTAKKPRAKETKKKTPARNSLAAFHAEMLQRFMN